MKTNRLKYSLIFLLVLVVSYYVNTNYRYYDIVGALSEFTFWMGFSIFILAVISVFIKENAYTSWKKFTNYFLVFAVLVILITPTSTHGMDFFPITKETVTIALSALYAVISLPLIIYKSFKKD
jgi:hypothetical protein